MSIVDGYISHLTTVNNTPKLAFCSSQAKHGARCLSRVATMLDFQLILRHNQMLLTLILNKLAFVLTSYLTHVELIASPHLWRLRVRTVS